MKRPSSIFLYPLFAFLFAAYVLSHPLQCSFYIRSALSICANTLIPALFPFIFASKLLACVLPTQRKSNCTMRFFAKLFGVTESLVPAVLLGLFSGFPSGAVFASEIYVKKACSKKQAIRAVSLSNNCSASFLISGAGVAVLGKASYGVLLIICQTLSVFFVSQLLKLLYGSTYRNQVTSTVCEKAKIRISHAFTQSIKSSCLSMLYISGFVIFFYLIASIINDALISFSKAVFCQASAFIGAALELSTGVFACRALLFPLSVVMCAFCSCFPSLSVLFQLKSICDEHFDITGEYIFTHICMALMSATFACVFLLLCGEPSANMMYNLLSFFIPVICILAVIFSVKKITRAKRVKNVQKN